MSRSIALRRSPKPGALTATTFRRAAQLVHHEGGQRLALDVLGDDHEQAAGRLATFSSTGRMSCDALIFLSVMRM